LQYSRDNIIPDHELLIENESLIFFGDVNYSFYKSINKYSSYSIIEENINLLNNGYIIFIDRTTCKLHLYTDIFGFYHIYFLINNGEIAISSEFKALLPFSLKQIDTYAELDILLFNYTLFDRTIVKDIRRFIGGVRAIWDGTLLDNNNIFNFAINFRQGKRKKISHKIFGNTLANGIVNEYIDNIPLYLTMSGGFDSRALLSGCKKNNIPINTFTFGQEGNIETETLKPFINEFVNAHTFLKLDEEYINSLESTFYDFLNKNLDNPVFHSLIEYQYSSNKIPISNLLVGFMGGELIIGQSLGSQVTFTQFAAKLLSSDSRKAIAKYFNQVIKENKLLKYEAVLSIANNYLKSLEFYFKKSFNYNILCFMLNEEYSKCFGAANNVFRSKYNLITPFVSFDFLNLLLNSNISLLYKKQFVRSPLANLRAKVLYAKAIEYLHPNLASTKFDRHYRVKDLSRGYLLPIAAYSYIANRIFKKNRKLFTSTTRYDEWYTKFVISELNYNDRDSNIFSSFNSITDNEFNNLPLIKKRELLRIMALFKTEKEIK
jgi:asparagine synthetase B (glutamine-hydrolysing)